MKKTPEFVARTRKMFQIHGVLSIIEYIGKKVNLNYHYITDDTLKRDLVLHINHPNPITKAIAKIRLEGKSVYSEEAIDAIQDVLKEVYGEEMDDPEVNPPINVDFQQGICFACGKLMEQYGYPEEARVMLHWGQIDLINF